ncbi:MAG: hypothetical protein SF051_05305 [Elusimicrobiota bacterium]|nr:hypothetical protein [Elusimicrobiota bacterium]
MKRISAPLFVALLVVTGCGTVPQASFNSYLQSFSGVKANAEDLYLRSTLAAENIASRPEKEGTVAEKFKELENRKAALETGLAAVNLIDRYNSVLIALASGKSKESVQSDLTGLQQDLSSLNLQRITKMVEKAGPYLEVVSQGVALVEDTIKRKKFAEAVAAAQKPMAGIVDILIIDADNLEELLVQDIQREQDPYFKQIGSYGGRVNKRLKELKSTPEIVTLLGRVNQARVSLAHESVTALEPQAGESASTASSADLDALTVLAGQTESAALAYNKIEERVKAQRAVFREYKNALLATKRTFAALKDDTEAGRYAATRDFIQQARDLRMAALKLREAR